MVKTTNKGKTYKHIFIDIKKVDCTKVTRVFRVILCSSFDIGGLVA